MALRTYELRLLPMIERLEAARRVVEELAVAKDDRKLIRVLEDGTYREADLDRLFAMMEEPLRAAVVILAGAIRRDGSLELALATVEDPYCRALLLLARPWQNIGNRAGLPEIDLSGLPSDDKALGRRGAAQIGLVRRLVEKNGTQALDALIDRAAKEGEVSIPRLAGEQVQRLLRLVGPIACGGDITMLAFRDESGRTGRSIMESNGEYVAEIFELVDK